MSKSKEPAVLIERVSKHFEVPNEQSSSLKDYIVHPSRIVSGSTTHNALKNIDLEVAEGEFLGIVGRNGGGKSTLLKILAGIYQPSEGRVRVRGKLVPFIELGVGFNPELTGRENVFLNAALFGFSEAETHAMYDKIVAFAELKPFMDQKLKNYSSGMQVRLAFSIAIQANADILLLDEVLAVGDAAFQRKCFNYFRRLKKDGKTVILVSHDMAAIREYCTRAVLIDDSKVKEVGDPFDIAEAYEQVFVDEAKRTESETQGSESKRSGTKELEISKVSLKPKLTNEDNQQRIEVHLKANADIETVNFGSSVQDATGLRVCGTNSQTKKLKIPSIKKGDTFTLEWIYPNIFRAGEYSLNLTLVDKSGSLQYDVWREAARFEVLRSEQTPYPVLPDIRLELKKDA